MDLLQQIKKALEREVLDKWGFRSLAAARRSRGLTDDELYDLTVEAEEFITREVAGSPPNHLIDAMNKDDNLFIAVMAARLLDLGKSPYVKVLDVFDAIRAAAVNYVLDELLEDWGK